MIESNTMGYLTNKSNPSGYGDKKRVASYTAAWMRRVGGKSMIFFAQTSTYALLAFISHDPKSICRRHQRK